MHIIKQIQFHYYQLFMNQTHRRNKTGLTSIDSNRFSMQMYINSNNHEIYVLEILNRACINKGINSSKMNIKQFSQLLSVIPIAFTNKLLHQLYLYATYQNGSDGKANQKRAVSIVNLEPNKINLMSAAKWIQHKIQKNKLSFRSQKMNIKSIRYKSNLTQSTDMRVQKSQKLPIIRTKPAQRFTHEVGRVLGIFSQIQKQRQNAGLEPICISQDQQQKSGQPTKQIHYDGDFVEVNQKIFKLRQQARQGIHEVIQATKNDKKLKKKFEQALMRYQRVRTQTNERTGRCGAMKAHKRIIDKQKQQIKKLERWRERTNQTELTSMHY